MFSYHRYHLHGHLIFTTTTPKTNNITHSFIGSIAHSYFSTANLLRVFVHFFSFLTYHSLREADGHFKKRNKSESISSRSRICILSSSPPTETFFDFNSFKRLSRLSCICSTLAAKRTSSSSSKHKHFVVVEGNQ
jgi:hypothetical protein